MKAFTPFTFNCIQCLHDVAWYGHLKLQEMKVISNWPLYAVILFSWMIALAEYSFQIPANRIGFIGNGGPFSLMQLKVIQEVVTLIIFTIFTTILFKGESLHWNHFAAFVCLVLAVYLSFINRMNVMSNGWNRQFYQGKLFVFAA